MGAKARKKAVVVEATPPKIRKNMGDRSRGIPGPPQKPEPGKKMGGRSLGMPLQ